MTFKSVVLTALLSLSMTAKAHLTQNNLKTTTNPQLQMLLEEALHWADLQGHSGVAEGLKVVQIKPAQKANESLEQALTRVLKARLHQAYPITGDDGGYKFQKMIGQTESQLKLKMDDWFFGDQEGMTESRDKILSLLLPISQNQDFALLYGSGSGNNTLAEIVAVLDLKNKEIIYLMVSNFGSDD